MKQAKWHLIVCLALLVSACGAAAFRSFHAEDGSKIKTIAVTMRDLPSPAVVDVRGAMFQSFGAALMTGSIAGPATASDAAAHSGGTSVTKLGPVFRVDFDSSFRAALTHDLAQDGYQIINANVREAARGVLPGSNKLDLNEVGKVPADAVLYVVVLSTSLSNSLLAGYRPDVTADIELIDVHTQQTLFYQRYYYGTSDLIGVIKFTPDNKYTFSSPEQIASSPAIVSESFTASIPLFANDLAGRLRKASQ